MKVKELTMKLVASLRRFRATSCGELVVALVLFTIISMLFLGLVLSAAPTPAYAVDATWLDIPVNSNWNTNFNWNTNAPVNPDDTATFTNSTITTPTLSSNVTIESITFASGADAFTILTGTNTLTLQGAGIVNNSTNVQTIINGPIPGPTPSNGSGGIFSTHFRNGATAANVTIINEAGFDTRFFDTSTAGSAMINNSELGSFTEFADTSTAGNATINNSGPDSVALFSNTSSAANATINNSGLGSFAEFADTSTAADATINNSGQFEFRKFLWLIERCECYNQQ